MSKSFPWFRLYANDLLGDRKIKRIQKATGLSLSEIRGAWLTIMCLASESPDRGALLFDGGVPYDYDDLVEESGMDSLKFHALFMHFQKMGMIAFVEENGIYYLPAWGERQPIGDTTGAERQKRYREGKKSEDETVTSPSRNSNALDIDIESEEEKESDTEKIERRRKLHVAFINASKLPQFGHLKPRDNEALDKMVEAHCEPIDIENAVAYNTKNNLQIVGIASVLNGSMIAMSERKRKENVTADTTVWAEEHY